MFCHSYNYPLITFSITPHGVIQVISCGVIVIRFHYIKNPDIKIGIMIIDSKD